MRIVVCDDHRLLLEALSHALATQGFTIESATSSPAEALAAVDLYDPDLLVVDLSFPDGDGLDVAREVMSRHPRTRVVILTASEDNAAELEAIRIGVAGYVRKDQRLGAIVAALGRAAAGEPWVDSTVVRRLRAAGTEPTLPRSPVDQLTMKERAVLDLLHDGLSTSEIVARLGIGNSTVRSHIQAILTKLGVHSRLEAVAVTSRHQAHRRAIER